MEKLITTLVAVLSIGGCSEKPDPMSERKPLPIIVQPMTADAMIVVAIEDFQSHQPPTPVDFRNVRFGLMPKDEQQNRALLCGEFLVFDGKDKREWTAFATIQTEGYEQWLGGAAFGICQQSNIKWQGDADYSAALKKKLPF